MTKLSPPQRRLLKQIVEETLHLEGDQLSQPKAAMALADFGGCDRVAIESLAKKQMVVITQHEDGAMVEATNFGFTATFVQNGMAKINNGTVRLETRYGALSQ
tara:strand:+ start:160409 stop:160717 length:309 start_codon:yes stop_codon:yes gene_type:complete